MLEETRHDMDEKMTKDESILIDDDLEDSLANALVADTGRASPFVVDSGTNALTDTKI